MSDVLLSVQHLATQFVLDEGVLRAVDDVSLDIGEREIVALVGESGSGKTIVALSILNIVPLPGRIVGGSVLFEHVDLLRTEAEPLRRIRGREIGMVFQEPGSALNPVLRIGRQIAEVLEEHRSLSRREAEAAAVRLLGDVGIPEPERWARAYPFELSGGMRQRAVIAMATCTRPKLLIADEPTTALDVTVQAGILDLLHHLRDQHGMAILLITHDLGVVAEIAERVIVMYTGKILEAAPTEELFDNPRHPYTQGLLASVLRLGAGRDSPLGGIPGAVPDLVNPPAGCTFHPRCPIAEPGCAAAFPPLESMAPGWSVACYKAKTSVVQT